MRRPRLPHDALPRAAALVALAALTGATLLPACRSATPDPATTTTAPPTTATTANTTTPTPTTTATTPAIAVRAGAIGRGPVSRPVRGTGIVRLKSEVDLSFKVGGVVTAVLVEEGAAVKKGQLLARLDPTEVDAALRQAKDGQAKADRDLERVRRLHASGALPVVELQNAETGASVARASVDAAGFNAQRAAIFAPDDGRIERRLVEPGEIAAPGRPAFHVSGRSKGAIVRLGLTDRDVLRVREGDIARVVLDARPELQLTAKVTQIAGMASPGSGTFDVEVRLDALPEGLLSGLTAKVEIHHDEVVAGVVAIGALVDGRGDQAAVFVVDGDRARKVPVKVAFLFGDRAALASSGSSSASGGAIATFPADTRVVESGAAQLEDGARIRITP